MKFRSALLRARDAVRENAIPGLFLQGLMLGFLALYLWNDGIRHFLERVARLKQESGYAFGIFSYVIAAAILPEVLRILFFQRGRVTGKNLRNFLGAAPMWGAMGLLVDLLYRLQARWFGDGSDFWTILPKVLVDQFLFSPFLSVPIIVGWLDWRDAGFRADALRKIFSMEFVGARMFPIMVAGWCVWIPGVSLVYFMPLPLQLPVAVIIQIFWVLLITTLSERKTAVVQALT
jgi:hypothetical protein